MFEACCKGFLLFVAILGIIKTVIRLYRLENWDIAGKCPYENRECEYRTDFCVCVNEDGVKNCPYKEEMVV